MVCLTVSAADVGRAETTNEWFYVDHLGESAGPVSYQRVRAMTQEGVLQPQSLVWAAHLPSWSSVDDVVTPGEIISKLLPRAVTTRRYHATLSRAVTTRCHHARYPRAVTTRRYHTLLPRAVTASCADGHQAVRTTAHLVQQSARARACIRLRRCRGRARRSQQRTRAHAPTRIACAAGDTIESTAAGGAASQKVRKASLMLAAAESEGSEASAQLSEARRREEEEKEREELRLELERQREAQEQMERAQVTTCRRNIRSNRTQARAKRCGSMREHR